MKHGSTVSTGRRPHALPSLGTRIPRHRPSRARTPERERGDVEVSLLSAYPDPTDGPAYLVTNVPEGCEHPGVAILDATGRQLQNIVVEPGIGIVEVQTDGWPPGLYLAQLTLDGSTAMTIKFSVQR